MEARINLRPGTWDQLIAENVLAGEYGNLAFAGRTVVDIGAHIGSFSLMACIAGARRVLAFEAGSGNFRLLSENCRGLEAIECHHAAVWRSDVPPGLALWRESANPENTGGGTVIGCASKAGEPRSSGEAVPVRQVPLDSIIEEAGMVDLLKVDAEGSEYPILYTSRKLDRVQEIVGEYHDIQGLEEGFELPQAEAWNLDGLATFLHRQGFAIRVQRKAGLGLFHAVRT
jgi:FkbM family methyltransferase